MSLLGLLGLGNRAGALLIGVDGVRQGLKAGSLRCVVLAADASPRALERVVRLAEARAIPLVSGPRAEELGAQLGRPPVMVVGVRDRALADGIVQSAPERQ